MKFFLGAAGAQARLLTSRARLSRAVRCSPCVTSRIALRPATGFLRLPCPACSISASATGRCRSRPCAEKIFCKKFSSNWPSACFCQRIARITLILGFCHTGSVAKTITTWRKRPLVPTYFQAHSGFCLPLADATRM